MNRKRKLNEAFPNNASTSERKIRLGNKNKKDPFLDVSCNKFVMSTKVIFKELEKNNMLKLSKVNNFDIVSLNDEISKYKNTKSKSK